MPSTATMTSSIVDRPSTAIPATQNTAPVHEFRCLYTHDLKRKQKRWQDGFLRFHTFNKRVMVYDVPRNYIGDTHWRDDHPVQEGDEFRLDRGVLVEVGEAVGETEQDLTEILEKRKKVVQSHASAAGDDDALSTVIARHYETQQSQHLRPKSLNAVLGQSPGPVGKAALPTKSPYERRVEAEGPVWQQTRPVKRRKVDNVAVDVLRPQARTLPASPSRAHDTHTEEQIMRPSKRSTSSIPESVTVNSSSTEARRAVSSSHGDAPNPIPRPIQPTHKPNPSTKTIDKHPDPDPRHLEDTNNRTKLRIAARKPRRKLTIQDDRPVLSRHSSSRSRDDSRTPQPHSPPEKKKDSNKVSSEAIPPAQAIPDPSPILIPSSQNENDEIVLSAPSPPPITKQVQPKPAPHSKSSTVTHSPPRLTKIALPNNLKPAPATEKDSEPPKKAPTAPAPTECKVDPWSNEAWDLLGCLPNGQACDFGTFKLRRRDNE